VSASSASSWPPRESGRCQATARRFTGLTWRSSPPRGGVLAVEVELSIKAPACLAAICRGWARARHIDGVYYLAAPSVEGALARAIRETRAEDRITVLPLEDTTALSAAAEREEAGHVDR
jgi:hypothetical protein